MRLGNIVMLLAALLALVSPAMGKGAQTADPQLAAEAQQGLDEILELWRGGNYAGLYERTTAAGKESRESFARRLSAVSRRPACCWEKIQSARVSARSDDSVTVRATFGFDGAGDSEYVTRSVRLVREDGVWKVSQADIISLAGAKKKYRHRHAKAKKDADPFR